MILSGVKKRKQNRSLAKAHRCSHHYSSYLQLQCIACIPLNLIRMEALNCYRCTYKYISSYSVFVRFRVLRDEDYQTIDGYFDVSTTFFILIRSHRRSYSEELLHLIVSLICAFFQVSFFTLQRICWKTIHTERNYIRAKRCYMYWLTRWWQRKFTCIV